MYNYTCIYMYRCMYILYMHTYRGISVDRNESLRDVSVSSHLALEMKVMSELEKQRKREKEEREASLDCER